MNEDIAFILEESQDSMNTSLEHLQRELSKVRTGKPSANLFDGIMVMYYGMATPMKQVASVSIPDAKTILIKPFDKSNIGAIEKAIFQANMGLTPQNDGEIIRISVPALTEERRRELVKKCKEELENCKISIRNARRDAITMVKDLKSEGVSEDEIKQGEEAADKLSKDYYGKAETLLKAKEEDIMKV